MKACRVCKRENDDFARKCFHCGFVFEEFGDDYLYVANKEVVRKA